MLLAYLDESYTRDWYYIAGICVPERVVRPLTEALDKVVREAARDYGVSPRAELHGHALVKGSEDWTSMAPMIRARIGIYTKAMSAIGAHDVSIVLRGLNVARQRERYRNYPSVYPPHQVVLQHIMERINTHARNQGEPVLLIADEISGQDGHRQDLWHYQQYGTGGYRRTNLGNIVDTIHFAPSNASRLLQAADLLAYMHRRRQVHTETDQRAKDANDLIWSQVQERIVHEMCWHP